MDADGDFVAYAGPESKHNELQASPMVTDITRKRNSPKRFSARWLAMFMGSGSSGRNDFL